MMHAVGVSRGSEPGIPAPASYETREPHLCACPRCGTPLEVPCSGPVVADVSVANIRDACESVVTGHRRPN